jgi:hypothetical protein
MDYTNPDFWIAIGVGGGVIGLFSAIQQVFSKNPEDPYPGMRYRSIFRDFFFGAFITAVLYMFLPESFQSMITAGQTSLSKLTGGASSLSTEVEIQTGPARF